MFLFDEIFLKLFNLSVTASWLILAVLVFRFILKKAPKWINCMLWLLVAVRLVCPFSFESILSLVPSSETITEQNFYYSSTPTISSGVEAFNRVVNPIISESLAPDPSASVNPTQILGFTLGVIWLLGALLMLLYAVISYIKLRKQVRTAIPLNENQWICDEVKSPFILGVFRPRIYLPSDLTGETLKHVIAHEKAHLKRKDHLWKPIGFILLSVYWFNPLMWLSYILLCRDIELACDEKVIKQMEGTDKKAYSEALLSCSVPQRMITVCPVAFGEVGVKKRIKSVLSYKKPAFWVILIAVVASIVVAVCFMTDPVDETNGGEDMYTWGVDEIDEDNFKMNEIMADVHTYTVKKGDTAYFDATAGNGLGEVSVFLDSLMLGKTTNKNVDYSLVDGCIVANSEKYGKVEIYFAENYSRLWLRSLSDTSESFVYVVLSTEKAREFFKNEEYIDPDSVWEYNVLSSASGHIKLYIYLEEGYKIKDYDISGMGNFSIDNSTDESGLDYIIFSPSINNKNGDTDIPVTVTAEKDGTETDFAFSIKKAGHNEYSVYYRVEPLNCKITQESLAQYVLEPGKNGDDDINEEAYSNIIDQIIADIDGDGKKEKCVLTYGPTSGLYTVVFTASDVGSDEPEYINTFNMSHTGGTHFHKTADGKTQIRCGNSKYLNGEIVETEDIFLDIEVKNGNIVLKNGDKKVGYWGTQGINPYEAMKKINKLEKAIGEAIIENNKNSFLIAAQNPENAEAFEALRILHIITDKEKNRITVYAQTLYEEFDLENAEVVSIASVAEPVEVVFDIVEDGVYELKKYRPLDKDENIEDILPDNNIYDNAETMEALRFETMRQAKVHYGYVEGDIHEDTSTPITLLEEKHEELELLISAFITRTVMSSDRFEDYNYHTGVKRRVFHSNTFYYYCGYKNDKDMVFVFFEGFGLEPVYIIDYKNTFSDITGSASIDSFEKGSNEYKKFESMILEIDKNT